MITMDDFTNNSITLKTIYKEQNGWLSRLPTAIFEIISQQSNDDCFDGDHIDEMIKRLKYLQKQDFDILLKINGTKIVRLHKFGIYSDKIWFSDEKITLIDVYEADRFVYRISFGSFQTIKYAYYYPDGYKQKLDKIEIFYRKRSLLNRLAKYFFNSKK